MGTTGRPPSDGARGWANPPRGYTRDELWALLNSDDSHLTALGLPDTENDASLAPEDEKAREIGERVLRGSRRGAAARAQLAAERLREKEQIIAECAEGIRRRRPGLSDNGLARYIAAEADIPVGTVRRILRKLKLAAAGT